MIDLAETRAFSFTSSATPEGVAEVFAGWLAKRTKKAGEASLTGDADLGSQFSYRMWGSSRRALRNLPIRVTWQITGADVGAVVAVQMRSNEGRYLFRTYQHHLIYQRTFDEMGNELEALVK
jgi:hypothetical protein